MKKIFLSLFVITLLITACDKKKTEPQAPATNGPAGPLPGQTYSNLQANYLVTNYGNNVITKDSSAFAAFYLNPPTSSGIPAYVNVGLVTLNAESLTLQSNNLYSKTGSAPFNNAGILSWSVAGSGTVSAFTHSYVSSFPSYNGAGLPDTCVKANGINISVSGVSNFNGSGFTVLISQASNVTYKYVTGSSGMINFTSTDLANYAVNTPMSIQVSFNNYTSAEYGGIKHGFSNLFTYNKFAYLK